MSWEAKFIEGNNVSMVDHTNPADIAVGTVLVVGVVNYVVHRPLQANRLGAVASRGGVYEGISDGSVDNGGVKVYWDDTAKKFTTTSAGNTHFGYSLPDQGASNDGDMIRVQHEPQGA